MNYEEILFEQLQALRERNVELKSSDFDGSWEEYRQNCETMIHLAEAIAKL